MFGRDARWIRSRRAQQIVVATAAATVVVLFALGEAGRADAIERIVATAVLAAAIAAAPWRPLAALAVTVAVPLTQVIGLLPRPDDHFMTPLWFGAIVVGIAATRPGQVRKTALISAAGAATLLSFAAAFGGALRFEWITLPPPLVGTPSFMNIGQQTSLHFAVFAAAFAVGFSIERARANRAAQAQLAGTAAELRDEQRRADDLAERDAIAQDLHDVLAHSLTVIVAQGSGALAAGNDAERKALQTMTDVARDALGDLRGLIERVEGNERTIRNPGLGDLPALADARRTRIDGRSATTEPRARTRAVSDRTGVRDERAEARRPGIVASVGARLARRSTLVRQPCGRRRPDCWIDQRWSRHGDPQHADASPTRGWMVERWAR